MNDLDRWGLLYVNIIDRVKVERMNDRLGSRWNWKIIMIDRFDFKAEL